MLSAGSEDGADDDPSGMAQLRGLAEHTTIAADAEHPQRRGGGLVEVDAKSRAGHGGLALPN